ncbi:MAG: hypothetical protein ACJ762_02855 [Solirubrobacteraceae bacterium]
MTARLLLALTLTAACALPATAPAATPGNYSGKTAQGLGITMTAGRHWISSVRLKVRDQCATRGVDNGPDHVKVHKDGRFRFVFTSQTSRFALSGRVRGRRITGRFSLRLTAGDGRLCTAGPVAFTVRLRN